MEATAFTVGAACQARPMNVREHQILGIEARRWKFEGAKIAAVREQVGLSGARYYQVLDRLIDRADVEAEYPMLVRRLRRLREARRAARSRSPR
jgi:hypothetical protein